MTGPRRTQEEYLALLEHTNFICLGIYKGSTTPILHKCKLCSLEWLSRPQGLLRKSAKCPQCDLINRRNSLEKIDKTISDAGLLRLSEYLGSLKEIKLRHIACGYEWVTKYSYIQQGSGCPMCNVGYGYCRDRSVNSKEATLYLLYIDNYNEGFYKIGISTRDINKRISSIRSEISRKYRYINIEVVASISLDSAQALMLEQEILKNSKIVRYTPNVKFSGSTECLNLINDLDYIMGIMRGNLENV